MDARLEDLRSKKNPKARIKILKGHFATSNCHSNYYIDVVSQKARLSEARAVAEELRSYYYADTIVDTILCLDGMEVVGACLASRLTESNYANMNAHQTIYVVTPETTSASQLMFRDNIVPMISGKNVMILAVSVASGKTVEAAIDAINYYGGKVTGISSIFSTAKECRGIPVVSVFDPQDLPDYASYDYHDCPYCKQGIPIDALVNSFGYSKL